MKKNLILLMTLFLAVFIIQTDVLGAKESFDKGHKFQFMQQLTEEQRDAVKEKVKELREAGASREEIHKEVSTLLKEFGVELPENFKGLPGHRPGRNKNRLMRFTKELTEEQRENLREKIESLREQGADRQEIRDTIEETLKSYGVEVPDNFHFRHGKRFGRAGFWKDLTDEQRKAVRTKVREMRKNGASREEIRQTVDELLESFGIKDIPNEDQAEDILESANDNLSVKSYPNPFNPETNIQYHINSASQVSLHIFDVQGKMIRSLRNEYQQSGTYTVRWDGLDDNGKQVPSGIYFLRINAGEETLNHRLVMMK
jgi:DNA-binding transcriptional regulator YhcF (GntR family)